MLHEIERSSLDLRVATINDAVIPMVNEGNPCWIGHGGMDRLWNRGTLSPIPPWDYLGIWKERPLGVHVNRGSVSRFRFHRPL